LDNCGYDKPAFVSDDEAVQSEIALFNMIEKAIMTEAEINSVLFLSGSYSSCSLAYNLDQCIERMRKKSPGIRIEVLTVISEKQV
jgi:hypothetical protein